MPQEYCPWCEEEQPIIETVAWQKDACKVCNQTIPESDGDQNESEFLAQ